MKDDEQRKDARLMLLCLASSAITMVMIIATISIAANMLFERIAG